MTSRRCTAPAGITDAPASQEVKDRIGAINNSAQACNLEAGAVDPALRTSVYFNCLTKELKRRGVRC